MYDDGDRLLFVLSARREMEWGVFKKAFDEFYSRRITRSESGNEDLPRFERFRVASLLSALGHCDVSRRERNLHLVAAPAFLAALPLPGLPRAVCCGARAPETFSIVRKVCRSLGRAVRLEISTQDANTAFCPSRICIEAQSEGVLSRVGEELGIQYSSVPPAWNIAMVGGSLDEYLSTLQWTSEREINWEREDFSPHRLRFGPPAQERGELRLTRYQDPVRLRWVYRMWRNGGNAPIDPAWGRYAILRATSTRVLLYDMKTGAAAVPRGAPLPSLFGRALALCSGYGPSLVPRDELDGESPERFGFDLYQGVGVDVLSKITQKIGQELPTERSLTGNRT